MTRSLLFSALAPALLLGGCMGTENRGIESVHQPVVARSDYALDLGTVGGALAAGEQPRLRGWMDTMHVGYGDRVAIDDPGGLSRRAREQVASVVAGYGLLLSDEAPVSPAPVSPGAIRVVVSRMAAGVPDCPDWSRDEAHEFNSNTSSNYGCAVNRNLAAMVARPEDLVHGRGDDGTTDPMLSGRAIATYRKSIASSTGTGGASAAGGGK